MADDGSEATLFEYVGTMPSGGKQGQGSIQKTVPEHVAAFALHQAATNIVFLVECMKSYEK